jgi:hypothetical protein
LRVSLLRDQGLKAKASSNMAGRESSIFVSSASVRPAAWREWWLMCGAVVEGEGAQDVLHDVVDLLGGVAEVDEGGAEGLVGDLEVTAAGEFLELHEGEVGFRRRWCRSP